MSSHSSHSKNTESHASSLNSHSFNSDPDGKGFVDQQKSTGSRRGTGKSDADYLAEACDLNFETRDIPFQVKTERAYEALKRDYAQRKQDKLGKAQGAPASKHPKFGELKD